MSRFSKLAVFILVSAMSVIAVSCNRETESFGECKYYDSLISKKSITFMEEIRWSMEQFGVGEEALDQYKDLIDRVAKLAPDYTVYAIRYKTVDTEGKEILASGIIYYPESLKVKGVALISPFNKSKGLSGSSSGLVAEAIPVMSGYIGIIPDLLGYGETSEYPICYYQNDNVVRLSDDMRKAAREFLLRERFYNIGNSLYLAGYSFGGSNILALARHYDIHPELGIKIKGLFVGGGAYHPYETFRDIYENGFSGYSVLPSIVWSLDKYENLGIDFSQVFIGRLKDEYETLITGQLRFNELTSILGTDIHAYLNDSFFREDNPMWLRLKASLLSKDIPFDWIPSYEVRIYHSQNDEAIPISASDALYAYFKEKGVKVEYLHGSNGSHITMGMEMSVDAGEYLMK